MGVDSTSAPPLPAPTETTESIAAPSESPAPSDVSKSIDEKSAYSLPDDGSPVTIRTRSHHHSRSQTSLLIEYFEGGKPSTSGPAADRQPDVRVRLIPAKRGRKNHIQITESKSGTRKASLSRRRASSSSAPPAPPALITTHPIPAKPAPERPLEEDAKSMNSYASATEESAVSRNNQPIDIEIDRGGSGRRRRGGRPLSPLIPTDSNLSFKGNASEISDIPADSFLDDYDGQTNKSDVNPDDPLVPAALSLAASGVASTAATTDDGDRVRSSKIRSSESRDHSRHSRDRSEHRHHHRSSGASKSRTRQSSGEIKGESRHGHRRRSSRGHGDFLASASESGRPNDQQSTVSAASKASSINNPKLLETVEDAIRRLILPELSALKREQSKRDSSRRGSVTSTTGTSLSREDVTSDRDRDRDRRKASDRRGGGDSSKDAASRKKDRRDREARHAYGDSSPSFDQDSLSESVADEADTPGRSDDRLKGSSAAASAAAAAAAAATGAALALADDRRQRRRRRADNNRGRGVGGGGLASDDYPEDGDYLSPPMPLMSEVNPSEVTRTSLLSADTDRPHSAAEEQLQQPVRDVSRGVASGNSTPTRARSPAGFPFTLGMKHANVSHGDLTTLARRRTGEYEGAAASRNPDDNDDDNDDAAAAALAAARTPHPEEEDLDGEHLDEDYDDLDYHHNGYPYPPGPYAYQQHVLSPIPSEAEGGSEAGESRLSRVSENANSPGKASFGRGHTPNPVPTTTSVLGPDFNDPNVLESEVNYQRSAFTESSEPGQQAVNTICANPNMVNVPFGIESAVASLIDGSVLTNSQVGTPREPPVAYEAYDGGRRRTVSPLSVESQQDQYRRSRHPSREGFAEEYEPNEYGQKQRYQPSPLHSASRQSPTDSEAAITAGAVAALRAKSRKAQVEDFTDEYAGDGGVNRNLSFKERAVDHIDVTRTHTRSAEHDDDDDDDDDDDRLEMGASGIPDWNNPMPEAEYIRHSYATSYDEELDGRRTPTQRDIDARASAEVLGAGAALTTAAVLAAGQGDEWHRTEEERKRDTLVTNPYEDTSPVANPALDDSLLESRGYTNYAPGFNTGSPGLPARALDEGYISSQGPVRTPDPHRADIDADDPYSGRPGNGYAMRHLSPPGLSQGRKTPIYDGATGMGMESIESRDIIALMQFLMARDAKKDAHEGALVQALIQTAVDMQNSFSDLRRIIVQTRDEINDNTDVAVHKAINGPRPFPGGANARSLPSAQGTQEEINLKKQSIFRRALKGLSNKGTNDLGRIEDMLNQLLNEVDILKTQTARPPSAAPASLPRESFEQPQTAAQPQPDMNSGGDRGYEPEDFAGPSGGPFTPAQSVRGNPSKQAGYDRRFSDHRISTVPEGNEDEHEHEHEDGDDDLMNYTDPTLMTAGEQAYHRRGSSVPLESPIEPASPSVPHRHRQHRDRDHHHQQRASNSAENTPKGDRNRKAKSGGLYNRVSRWSETTASSVGRVFRSSGATASKRDTKELDYLNHPPSRSDSSLGSYDDHSRRGSPRIDVYGDDRLHSGFSDAHLVNDPHDLDAQEPPPLPNTYMTPEDPKYKAHRDSINLQHPQPRPGQTERFRNALESSAQEFVPGSPRSADWNNSVTSINRLPPNQNARYHHQEVSSPGGPEDSSPNWRAASPASPGPSGPPRPPKEPIEGVSLRTPPRVGRVSQLAKGSPLESAHGSGSGSGRNYTSSPKPENRNLNNALGMPARRPSGPRAMTPKNPTAADEYLASLPRERRKRDTFGSIATHDPDRY